MTGLQIALDERYATKDNLEKIAHIAPEARIVMFSIRLRFPFIRKVRGLLRRILPFSLYNLLSSILDRPSEAARMDWIDPPTFSDDMKNILLFPPDLNNQLAKELLVNYRFHWVHSITTGVDHIPALPKDTLLTSSKGMHSRRIAEFTLGLIFALAKNIPQHTLQTRKRLWKTLPSEMIQGSRLGIVGLGSIGTEVARLGKAVGMEVWATKRTMTNIEFVDRILTPKELPHLLREVDYLVLAVPLTRDTRYLIGKEELNMMKTTAYLINISRGSIVDENFLYQALRKGSIRGACIDVFQNEKPLPKNNRFYKLPNLLITSYSAYYSGDSLGQVMDLFFENLRRFIAGDLLLNLADTVSNATNNLTQ